MITLIRKSGINPNTKKQLFYPRWSRRTTVNETQMAKQMARTSTFSVGEIGGVLADFSQSIIDELLNGNAVSIDGLGTFELKVHGKSQERKEDVTSRGVKVSMTFEPDAELSSRLQNESEFQFLETAN